LAVRQHGTVSRAQLIDLGLGHGAIDHRVKRGLLHPVHRGVYAVGHPVLSREGRWLAAVLAAGPGAVLSHMAAASLWCIRDSHARDVDVIVPRDRKRPGIRIHRVVLRADEVTVHRGIPVTNPARTLLDLAEQVTPHQLERAVHEAEYLRLTSAVSLDGLLTRHHGRRGTKALKDVVSRGRLGQDRARNDFEVDFIAFVDAHRLPRPRMNQPIGRYVVDAVWPQQRLVVELDGRDAHGTTRAFEADRARDRDLQTAGFRVLRITSRQLDNDAATIAQQLATLLSPSTSPAASPRRP